MYLAMDDFGDDYFEEIKNSSSEVDRWKKIFHIANYYGFTGIQINSAVYKEGLGLSLKAIPNYFDQFRLTYHIDGISTLIDEDDYQKLNGRISESLTISDEFEIEDVSFHPPIMEGGADSARDNSKKYLERLIEYWIPKFKDKNITLSLETHVSSEYFIFKGLYDFRKFATKFNELGVLIDISHNFYDGYAVDEVISTLSDMKITGLHLSDAIVDMDFHKGTHLPIGKGNVDFKRIVQNFQDNPNVYGALEIKGSSKDILNSVNALKRYF